MAEYEVRRSLPDVVRRIARAEKLVILLLLFILLTASTAGVTAVLTGPDWASLWVSLLLGMLIGWLFAILRWRAWWSAVLAIGLGLLFSLLFTTGLIANILAVIGELLRLVGHVVSTLRIKGIDFTPLNSLVAGAFSSTGIVLVRVYTWLKDLFSGQPAFDPVAAGFVWSTMVWLVAAWAGWVVEASKNALLAVLPALLLNLSTLSYGHSNSGSIYLSLGTMLVLTAAVQYDRREQEWTDSRVAYPARKGREVGNSAVILAIVLVVLAAFISSLSLQRIIHWTSDLRRNSGQPENGLAKSLGIVPAPTATPDSFTPSRSPGLPRELLIGSGPELSTQVVMSVQVQDLGSLIQGGQLAPLYWRSFTYDIYTGHGWSSSATQQSTYQPNQAIQPAQLQGHQLIQERVGILPWQAGTIYSAGEPISIDVASSAAWRSSNDLFGIQAGSGVYLIESSIPVVGENSLKRSGQAYPGWVTQRYLALPDEVPTRVKQLAIKLTAAEATPYDRAKAIEGYLRQTYPYSLDIPRPPANQDLADYFLFDLKKGYCDFYASAMVVLARAAGIPARFAVGYAPGTYNEKNQRFIVTQADAHSWVEVYFPGIGWVPFEPTAGLPPINRSAQPTQEVTSPAPLPTAAPKGVSISIHGNTIGLALLTLIAVAAAIWALVDELRLRQLKPKKAAQAIYLRLRRYGELLKVPLDGGETPYEFAAALRQRTTEIIPAGSSASIKLVRESRELIQIIVRLSYHPADGGSSTAVGIIRQWSSLRWRLRLMWLFQVWESARTRFTGGFTGQAGKGETQAG